MSGGESIWGLADQASPVHAVHGGDDAYYYETSPPPAAMYPPGRIPPAMEAKGRVVIAPHRDSSQVSNIFNPTRGVRDEMERRGLKPRDHHKDNRRYLKELAQMNQIKKIEDDMRSQPKPGKGKMAGVPSSGYGKAGARPAPQHEQGGDDFVSRNAMDAGAQSPQARLAHMKPAARDGTDWTKKKNYGSVPKYLQERKMELAMDAAARRRAEEAEDVPPGMVLLSEDERVEMLDTLEENRKTVEGQLSRMPFKVGRRPVCLLRPTGKLLMATPYD